MSQDAPTDTTSQHAPTDTTARQASTDSSGQSFAAGIGEVLGELARGVGDAVRNEVEDVREDLAGRAAGGAKGAALLTGAGAAGTVALGAGASLPIIALRRVMPGWAISLLIAGGAGALAVVLARRGLGELGEAAPIDADRVREAARAKLRSLT